MDRHLDPSCFVMPSSGTHCEAPLWDGSRSGWASSDLQAFEMIGVFWCETEKQLPGFFELYSVRGSKDKMQLLRDEQDLVPVFKASEHQGMWFQTWWQDSYFCPKSRFAANHIISRFNSIAWKHAVIRNCSCQVSQVLGGYLSWRCCFGVLWHLCKLLWQWWPQWWLRTSWRSVLCHKFGVDSLSRNGKLTDTSILIFNPKLFWFLQLSLSGSVSTFYISFNKQKECSPHILPPDELVGFLVYILEILVIYVYATALWGLSNS